MITLSIEEMKRDVDGYIKRVTAGETLVLTQADRPVAEVVPISASDGELRPFGLCAGLFTVPDDFDAPLPDDILRDFDGR